MSQSRNSFSSRWKRMRRRAANWLSTIGQWILAPIKLLFLPAKLLDLFHRSGVNTSRRVEKRAEARAKSKSKWRLLGLPFVWLMNLILLPVELIRNAFRRGRQKYLLFFIPLMGAVVLLGFIGYQLVIKSAVIQDRYFRGAKRAVQSGNMNLATIYFRRLIDREELTDSQSLQWAFVLLEKGDRNQYQQIVDRLASTQNPGYPPAHSVQALSLATKLQQQEQEFNQNQKQELAANLMSAAEPAKFKADAQTMNDLAFHLAHADKTDNRVKIAQAIYFVHSQQVEEAVRYLTDVAQESPSLYLEIANLAQNRGVDKEIEEALNKASVEFGNQLKQTPLNENIRLLLVKTCLKLDRAEEAERLVREGLRIFPTAKMRRAGIELIILRLNENPPRNEFRSLGNAMTELKMAIESDPNYRIPYQKLVAMLLEFSDPRNRLLGDLPIQQVLEAMLTSDRPRALDHCNLAYLLWVSGEKENAMWHLEQAWGMEDQFSNLAHHLAFEFVTQNPENDEWGILLARRAIEKSPDASGPRLTMGRILYRQGQSEAALVELELALKTSETPHVVHYAMAIVLSKLGRKEEAVYHRRQADAIFKNVGNGIW